MKFYEQLLAATMTTSVILLVSILAVVDVVISQDQLSMAQRKALDVVLDALGERASVFFFLRFRFFFLI